MVNLIHQDTRSVIKVVRYGLTIQCWPDAHTVELIAKQITRQREQPGQRKPLFWAECPPTKRGFSVRASETRTEKPLLVGGHSAQNSGFRCPGCSRCRVICFAISSTVWASGQHWMVNPYRTTFITDRVS